MAVTTTMVHVPLDENVKAQVAEALASAGLIRAAADKERPSAFKTPNATTRAAMAEADDIIRSHRARFATTDAAE